MLAADPALRRRLLVVVAGGPSGNGLERPTALADLAAELGIVDVVRFEPPGTRADLADWYRAADVVVVPSHSESFGLVAIEAQACGTPVVAAAVGGLATAVADEASGLLVASHDPGDFAHAIDRVLREPGLRYRLADGARRHASAFGWAATTAGLLASYSRALDAHRRVEARAVRGS
jgi:D-inositol-3-phosphate glycosyltransferase